VGEWLKPADCKSAAPCGLRRFESSPVHQRLAKSEGEIGLERSGSGQAKLVGSEGSPGRDSDGAAKEFDGETGSGLGSSVGRARPW
jgi:hypothetical protein